MSYLLIELNYIYNSVLKEFDSFSDILDKFPVIYSDGDVDINEYDMYLLEKDPNLKLEIWNNFKNSNLILSNKVTFV
ncbi:hypothetical protein MUA77_11690 [Mammaliicoccus sciuri]|uniref:hypothetical protein n=1 Tax=Mammaliicoccus sciuri TaxID=1296 RepID=UPI0021D35D4A|nr:hypothetical protein [Mammaliicoccus sciuri]UXU83462.1 hypothetical protein MUA77_11690 [Mammaliicoccus sciuri]UXU93309.1 hypothetical protein MUA42_11700 [Mammaliicoccus sciuri]UXV15258.1 hypothetical protein MUA89_11965 [Mammaliicoccus sciuri]UXV23522.1 hypothetical protein MUA49_11695 [Mammaliicoccus sciuri]UXV26301.1 hypothetical protein MUA96_11950 [Mammaliicoccus sciuri]